MVKWKTGGPGRLQISKYRHCIPQQEPRKPTQFLGIVDASIETATGLSRYQTAVLPRTIRPLASSTVKVRGDQPFLADGKLPYNLQQETIWKKRMQKGRVLNNPNMNSFSLRVLATHFPKYRFCTITRKKLKNKKPFFFTKHQLSFWYSNPSVKVTPKHNRRRSPWCRTEIRFLEQKSPHALR
jgi:hypothetical protein